MRKQGIVCRTQFNLKGSWNCKERDVFIFGVKSLEDYKNLIPEGLYRLLVKCNIDLTEVVDVARSEKRAIILLDNKFAVGLDLRFESGA